MGCPICNGPITVKRNIGVGWDGIVTKYCTNHSCYYKRKTTTSIHYKVFNESFMIMRVHSVFEKISIWLQIKRKIRYWKKDMKYVAQILIQD